MPLYSYSCKKCEKYFEVIIPLKDCEDDVHCKYCGEKLQKLIMPVMVRIN